MSAPFRRTPAGTAALMVVLSIGVDTGLEGDRDASDEN